MNRALRAIAIGLVMLGCGKADAPSAEEQQAKLERTLAEADARLRNGKDADAEALYTQALVLAPEDPQARAGLAAIRLARGQLDEARSLIEAALKTSASPGNHALHGRILAKQGAAEPAAAAFARAFTADPENARHALLAGEQLLAAEQFSAAEAMLRRALDVEPQVQNDSRTGANTLLGDALREQDKLDEALRTYMKAQTTSASDKRAHAGAALVYEAKGDLKHALDEWSFYIRMDCCSEYSNTVAKTKMSELGKAANAAAPSEPDDASAAATPG